MTELLDTPVGDFEWGPNTLAHRWRDRIGDTMAAILPLVAIAIGAALLTIGIALGWSTMTREPADRQNSAPGLDYHADHHALPWVTDRAESTVVD